MEGLLAYELKVTDNHVEVYAHFSDLPSKGEGVEKKIEGTAAQIQQSLRDGQVLDHFIVPDLEANLKQGLIEDKKTSVLVAKGRPPTNGKPGRTEILIDLEHKAGHIDKETGKIDHRNLGILNQWVAAGVPLAKVIKEIQGSPGMNLYGEQVLPEQIPEIERPNYDGQTIEAEDTGYGWLLKSKRTGFFHIDHESGLLEISPSITSERVGLSGSGNIVSDGSVDITVGPNPRLGDDDIVEEGSKIVGRKIIIHGNVGSHVEISGTEIIIKGRVQPHSSIVASKALFVSYVYGGSLIGHDIQVGECWYSRIEGNRTVVKQDAIGCQFYGGQMLVLGTSKNCQFFSSSLVAVGQTYEMETSKLIIDPLQIPANAKKYENLCDNFNKMDRDLKVDQIDIEQEQKTQASVIQNLIDHVARSNGLRLSFDQKEKLFAIIQGHGEQNWLRSMTITDYDRELLERLQQSRKKLDHLEQDVKVKGSQYRRVKKAMERLENSFTQGKVLLIQDCAEGTWISFGKSTLNMAERIVGPILFKWTGKAISREKQRIDLRSLKKSIDDYDHLFKQLQDLGQEEPAS